MFLLLFQKTGHNSVPFFSSVWEDRVQSLQTLLGSSRASEDAGTIWLVSNRTYRLQEDSPSPESCPFSDDMPACPIAVQDAASLSPEEVTDFTFSKLSPKHARCLTKQAPGYPSDFPSRKFHVVARTTEIRRMHSCSTPQFYTALASQTDCHS